MPIKPAPKAVEPWTTAAPADDDADAAEPVLDPVLELLLDEDEAEPVAEDRLAEDVIVAVVEAVELPAPVGVVEGAAVLEAVPEPAVALYTLHSEAAAVWACSRPAWSQLASRQETAKFPMAAWEAQAQPWSEAGVQTEEMADLRQGVWG